MSADCTNSPEGCFEVTVGNTPIFPGTFFFPYPLVTRAPPPTFVGSPTAIPTPNIVPVPGRPSRAPPPPTIVPPAEPGPAPATISEAFAQLGPVAASVAPFAFALDQPAPSLQTGEELFAQLLAQEYTPMTPLTEFEQLLERGPLSQFDQLLQKPLIGALARGEILPEVTVAAAPVVESAGMGLLSRLVGVLGGPVVAGLQALFYSADAGLPNESDIVSNMLRKPPPEPPTKSGPEGLPSAASGSVPESVLAPLLVSASRIAADLAPGTSLGLEPFTLGAVPLPSITSLVQPFATLTPGHSTLTLPGPLTRPAPGRSEGRPARQPQPRLATLPSQLPTPQTAAQNQPQKCEPPKKQKKKKKPRTKCYKGTYVDRKHGLLKYPREEIKCQ